MEEPVYSDHYIKRFLGLITEVIAFCIKVIVVTETGE